MLDFIFAGISRFGRFAQMKSAEVKIFAVLAALRLSFPAAFAQMDELAAVTNNVADNDYLQIEEQFPAPRLAIEASRLVAADEAQKPALEGA